MLAQRYLPHSAPGGASVNASGRRLDVIGLALLTVAVLGALNGLVELHHGGATAWLLLLAALAALSGFIVASGGRRNR